MEDHFIQMGENIKKLRTQKGLSQADLASLLKVDKAYISRIENGKKNLTLNSLTKISVALGVDIKHLF